MNKIKRSILVLIVIGLISFNIPMPYYVMQPGTAEEIGPMIEIENTDYVEKGTFLLTTVFMGEANLLTYGYATVFDGRSELIPKEHILSEGESPENYTARQTLVMEKSQSESILVGFRAAGVPIEAEHQGVVVMTILENMPAAKVLKVGDVIRTINEKPIRLADDLIDTVKGKKEGDAIKLGIEREGKSLSVEVKLAAFDLKEPVHPDAPKFGIGISLEDSLAIKPSKKVTIDAGAIGGPSAGLMFSLEIFNQLTSTDWTKGYRIAGTGTIDADGDVGQIGGVEFKIYAAAQEDVDIFFVPKDLQTHDTNEKKAKEAAEQIKTDMRVIPIANFKDAMEYLKRMEPKKAG
jgi:PDZ domain-containing protein